jgi:hypothetical protein
MTKYKESQLLCNFTPDQSSIGSTYKTDIERYRSLQVMKESGLSFYNKNKTIFNTYINILRRFGREKE